MVFSSLDRRSEFAYHKMALFAGGIGITPENQQCLKSATAPPRQERRYASFNQYKISYRKKSSRYPQR